LNTVESPGAHLTETKPLPAVEYVPKASFGIRQNQLDDTERRFYISLRSYFQDETSEAISISLVIFCQRQWYGSLFFTRLRAHGRVEAKQTQHGSKISKCTLHRLPHS
jgi:hypothetical protein